MKRIFILLVFSQCFAYGFAQPIEKEKSESFVEYLLALKISTNHLKMLALSMHTDADNTSSIATRDIRDKNGKALLSWRVQILPFLEQGNLYQQFNLDEPWDSEHNKKLIEKIPKVYLRVGVKNKEKGLTYYRRFDGPGAVYDRKVAVKFPDGITDGLSNTIGVVEAGEPVIWTQPENDLPYDPKKPLPKLGGMFDGVFHIVMLDGTVHRGHHKNLNAEEFRKLITCAGGEKANIEKALGK